MNVKYREKSIINASRIVIIFLIVTSSISTAFAHGTWSHNPPPFEYYLIIGAILFSIPMILVKVWKKL